MRWKLIYRLWLFCVINRALFQYKDHLSRYGDSHYEDNPDSKVHGANLGPTGPRWAPCWPHELCYLGIVMRPYCLYNGNPVLVRQHLYIETATWEIYCEPAHDKRAYNMTCRNDVRGNSDKEMLIEIFRQKLDQCGWTLILIIFDIMSELLKRWNFVEKVCLKNGIWI